MRIASENVGNSMRTEAHKLAAEVQHCSKIAPKLLGPSSARARGLADRPSVSVPKPWTCSRARHGLCFAAPPLAGDAPRTWRRSPSAAACLRCSSGIGACFSPNRAPQSLRPLTPLCGPLPSCTEPDAAHRAPRESRAIAAQNGFNLNPFRRCAVCLLRRVRDHVRTL